MQEVDHNTKIYIYESGKNLHRKCWIKVLFMFMLETCAQRKISLGLNIVGHILDNVNIEVNKIYNKALAVF